MECVLAQCRTERDRAATIENAWLYYVDQGYADTTGSIDDLPKSHYLAHILDCKGWLNPFNDDWFVPGPRSDYY